jgi:hypothetical protein
MQTQVPLMKEVGLYLMKSMQAIHANSAAKFHDDIGSLCE